MKTILVTGGAGFVGSCLAIGLRKERPGTRVVSLDNLKRRGSELNLPRLREAGVEFIHGDVRNMEDLESVGPIDLILECSAEPSVLAGYTSSPNYLVNTNLGGTINCLELARKHGAGMIFLSTSRVYPVETLNALRYGEQSTRFALDDEQSVAGVSRRGISEDFPLEGARSLYGATKLCSELILREYAEMYSLRTVVNRCGVLTGPWQMGKIDQGVVVLWAAKHFFGGSLRYIGYGGQGKQVRDMLHVDDLCRLILHQIDRLDELAGQTFNVGGGPAVSVSLQELTALCRDLTGRAIPIESEPADRPADIRIYLTDNARVASATGWRPEKDVPAIMEDICAWMRDHQEALAPIFSDTQMHGMCV
jgi:CDP-paratose 2-epimerase